MDDKTVLFVGGGYEAVEGVKHARELGYGVVVLDMDKDCPSSKFADDSIVGDVYDYEHALGAVKRYKGGAKINGVITLGCDASVAVARISEYLGLKSINLETAELATNKLLMKNRLGESGVSIPEYFEIGSLDELKEAAAKEAVFVLKPIDNRGARGVLRVDAKTDLPWAYRYCSSYAISDKTLLLEEWIEGEQISAEAIVYEGRVKLCAVAHRGYERTARFYPNIIEDGGETPADIDPGVFVGIERELSRAAKAIGLRGGTLKGDLVVTPDGRVVIIEVAARLSGGNFCTINIPHVYGIDMIDAALKIATGRPIDLEEYAPRPNGYVANRYLFLEPGMVESVRFEEDISKIPGVIYWRLNVRGGESIGPVTDHTKRHGTVIAAAPTRKEAVKIAEEALGAIKIEYKTDPAIESVEVV